MYIGKAFENSVGFCYNECGKVGEKMSNLLKKKKCFLFSLFFVMTFFVALTNSQALTGTINADGVNFRSGAGVNYSSFGSLSRGTTVTV